MIDVWFLESATSARHRARAKEGLRWQSSKLGAPWWISLPLSLFPLCFHCVFAFIPLVAELKADGCKAGYKSEFVTAWGSIRCFVFATTLSCNKNKMFCQYQFRTWRTKSPWNKSTRWYILRSQVEVNFLFAKILI